MTKRDPIQEHMPVVMLGTPGQNHGGVHVECDYCDADATSFHWASNVTEHSVDRDCYACDEHAGLLNRYHVTA
jgi:hypothetical protein